MHRRCLRGRPAINSYSRAILRSGRGRLGQRHGLIIKGKRRSCLLQYGHRDRTRGRLRQRHGSEHGFPLIRSLRASAQRSTSVLFSFVLSLIVAASFTIPAIKNELRLPNNVHPKHVHAASRYERTAILARSCEAGRVIW